MVYRHSSGPENHGRRSSVLWCRPLPLVRRLADLIIALVLLAPAQAGGQAPLLTRALDSGTVVRVHFVQDGFAQGPLLMRFGPTSDSLRYCVSVSLRCAGQGTVVPVTTITRLEVLKGTRAGRGFLIGTAVAALIVVPYLQIAGSFAEGETRGSLLTKGVLISVVVGGGLGLLIGHGDQVWSSAP